MSTRWAPLTDWLLGTEPQQRVRAARCGLACALMLYSIASMGYFVWVGMAPAWPVAALALVGLGGMVACFAVIRSGANLRLADPSLTGVQMSFALIVGAVAYTLAGRGRGAVFPIMMVVLMFGLYSLKPREVRLMSLLALLLFGGAMALMAWISPAIYRPEVEFAHFLVIAIMLPAVSMLAGQLSRLRDRLRRQKAELRREAGHLGRRVGQRLGAAEGEIAGGEALVLEALCHGLGPDRTVGEAPLVVGRRLRLRAAGRGVEIAGIAETVADRPEAGEAVQARGVRGSTGQRAEQDRTDRECSYRRHRILQKSRSGNSPAAAPSDSVSSDRICAGTPSASQEKG